MPRSRAQHRNPTVAEVARRANVSRAAVYAVLNAHKPTNIGVGPEKRDRVLRAAKELGYVRNELARSMVTGKSHTIGVLVYSLKTSFYTDFFTHFDDACYRDGYTVLVASSEYDAHREARNLRTFLAKRVDGVVVGMDYPNPNEAILRQFVSQGLPVVHFGGVEEPRPPYPSVGFAERHVGRFAGEHLYELGHRHAAYLAATESRDTSRLMHGLRRKWFAEVWYSFGSHTRLDTFQTADVMHGGIELAKVLAQKSPPQRPTAVVCSTDRLAISLVSALRAHEIRVPQQISVVGCDDIVGAAECVVPLTTVRLPTRRLAEGAWILLQDLLDRPKQKEDQTPKRVIIEPELVVRESSCAVEIGP
jgi:LacI family transcriptional regulator